MLLPEHGELSPGLVALVIADRLIALEIADAALVAARAEVAAELAQARGTGPVMRAPMFCSGCPHNRSTRVRTAARHWAGLAATAWRCGSRS